MTVVNRGKDVATGAVNVDVLSADGARVLVTTSARAAALAPGESITIDTGYRVHGSQSLVVIINRARAITESNYANDTTPVAVSGG